MLSVFGDGSVKKAQAHALHCVASVSVFPEEKGTLRFLRLNNSNNFP